MAIKVISPNAPTSLDSIHLQLDNGDYKVLNLIKERWKFKNEESLLRFALAVLLTAEEQAVSVRDESGKDVTLKPTEDLLVRE